MNRSTDQLDWIAARYVLGELDPAETASFEERLGDDEVAADAVVAAMRIVDAIVAVKPVSASCGVQPNAAHRHPGWRRWPWAAAACVAVAMLPWIAERRSGPTSEPVDIVRRWQEMPLEHFVGSGVQATLESPAADRLPPWLVAAVAIAAEGAAAP